MKKNIRYFHCYMIKIQLKIRKIIISILILFNFCSIKAQISNSNDFMKFCDFFLNEYDAVFTGTVLKNDTFKRKYFFLLNDSIYSISTFKVMELYKGEVDSEIKIMVDSYKPLITGKTYFIKTIMTSKVIRLESYDEEYFDNYDELHSYMVFKSPFHIDSVLRYCIRELLEKNYIIFSGRMVDEEQFNDSLLVRYGASTLICRERKFTFEVDSCYNCKGKQSRIVVFSPVPELNGYHFVKGHKYLVYAVNTPYPCEIQRLRVIKPETLTIPFEFAERQLKIIESLISK